LLDKTNAKSLIQKRGFFSRMLEKAAGALLRLAGRHPLANDAFAVPPFVDPLKEDDKTEPNAWYKKITSTVLARAGQKPQASQNPFKLPEFPPNARPTKDSQMAMDDAGSWASGWWQNSGWSAISGVFAEGLAFPGYAWLAEQAQRGEYRKFGEIIATEMTREWIRLQSTGDDSKTEKINRINDRLDELGARDVFRKCIELDEWFGRAHLYIDTGATDNRDELKIPLGNGRDLMSKFKVGKGQLKAIRAVEPVWAYPTTYNSNDPLKKDWYEPEHWFVLGKEVHATRLLKFVGKEVPDLLKPAYSFGGISMIQLAQSYVNNWLRTRQSVSDLLHSFSVFVLATDMGTSLTDAGDELFDRVHLFNRLRDNRGLMMTNKETEALTNVSVPLGGLHELQAQAQEQMCSIASIPVVKFLGIQPTGLNASDEGGIRMFYDWILSQQEKRLRPHLTTIIDFVQLSEFGEIDQEITFQFIPLYSLDEQKEAEKRKTEADTASVYIDSGVLAPEEVREKLASDPESPYSTIDVENVPDLREEEEMGLMPKGGRPNPLQETPEAEAEAEAEEDKESGDEEEDETSQSLIDKTEEDSLPFQQRVKARTIRHTQRKGSFYDDLRERAERHKRGEGDFYDRARERSERGQDYLKQRIGTDSSFGAKKRLLGELLAKGATSKELLVATGWKAISVPAVAKSLGMDLKRYEEDGIVRYQTISKNVALQQGIEAGKLPSSLESKEDAGKDDRSDD
jgi:uncharacterized protein